MKKRSFLFVSVAIAPTAIAQSGDTAWIMEFSSGVVTPTQPSVTVRLLARFPESDFAWGAGRWDVLAGEGQWSGLTRLLIHNLAPSLGTIQGGDVLDIAMGQFNFQPNYADPANPIPVWQATWTATDFAPRRVEFATRTRDYRVYPERWSLATESRLSSHREGFATVRVVPVPAAGLLLMACATRRRR